MADLGQAYVQIVPSAEGIGGAISDVLNKEAATAGEQAGETASTSLGGSLKSALGSVLQGDFASAGQTMGELLGGNCINATTLAIAGGAAAVGAAVAGIVKLAGETSTLGDTIDKQSQKLGISNKAYQEWSFIMQHCGTDIGTMKGAMNGLQKASESNSKSFEALGISLEDVGNMTQEDLFSAVITGLQQMEPGAERNAIANDLLGRSYRELQPLLNTTAEDTEAMKEQINDLGGVMSDKAVADSAAYQDALLNMDTAISGVKNSLGSAFLPVLTSVTEGFAEFVGGLDIGDKIESVSTWFTNTGNTISSLLKPALDNLKTAFSNVGTALSPVIKLFTDTNSKAEDNAKKFNLAEAAGKVLSTAVNALAKVFETVANVIKTVISVVTTVHEKFTTAKEKFGEFKDKVSDGASSIAKAVKDKFKEAKEKLKPFTDAIDSAKEKFNSFKDKITAPFKLFSGLKIPKITISGGSAPFGIGGMGTKPSISVKWNAKAMNTPYMLDGATIFGSIKGNYLGGGETGKELIYGRDALMRDIRQATGNNNGNMLELLYGLLQDYLPELGNQQIVLDSGTLVGSTVALYDRELGKRAGRVTRGV